MSEDLAEIGRAFKRAFREAGDMHVETDPRNQLRAARQLELDDWNIESGRRAAAAQHLELDDPRLRVVRFLRDDYLEHGTAHDGRELGEMLEERFSTEGGLKYLRRLFPAGPVAQGMQIAGLPLPAHTADQGFGTAR